MEIVLGEDEFTISENAFDMDAFLQDLAENPDVSEEMYEYFYDRGFIHYADHLDR